MSDVVLFINGKSFAGWQQVEIRRSMETLANDFTVSYGEKWDPSQLDPSVIEGGNSVRVAIDGQQVISGFVDEDNSEYDAENDSLSITGRSRTGDLVDCSVDDPTPREWNNCTPLKICQDICTPFGINVSLSVATGSQFGAVTFTSVLTPVDRFAIQPEEKAFEALSRIARQRGFMLFTSTSGDLQIIRSRAAPFVATKLERGVNVLTGSRRTNWRERFSSYKVIGQIPGTDQNFGALANELSVTTTDNGVTRYRPLVVLTDMADTGGKEQLYQRMSWERNGRQGRSRRLNYRVQGWKHSKGIWSPYTMVNVRDDKFRVRSAWLIASVRLVKSLEEGEVADLELTMPAAFDVEPFVDKPNIAQDYGLVPSP